MEKWFTSTPMTLIAISLSTLGIYIAIILFTRLFGKRRLSKMSSFDFAMTVAAGSFIATTALSPSVSLLDGIVGLFMIYFFNLAQHFYAVINPFEKLLITDLYY